MKHASPNPHPVYIDTPNGKGKIEKIYVSELGYLMVKIMYENPFRYVSYNCGNAHEILIDGIFRHQK